MRIKINFTCVFLELYISHKLKTLQRTKRKYESSKFDCNMYRIISKKISPDVVFMIGQLINLLLLFAVTPVTFNRTSEIYKIILYLFYYFQLYQ